MPVRIYDIAKELGADQRNVLRKAKELGITAAKVPSSSLDKITAEFLTEELRKLPPAELIGTADQRPPIAAGADALAAGQTTTTDGQAIVTIKANSPDLYHLVEKILAGVVRLQFEVTQAEGTTPLRLQLAKEKIGDASVIRAKTESLPRVEITERTKRLFKAAYDVAFINSKDEWANLAEFGNALKKIESTFQPQDYGERSLGSLIRRMTDVFEIRPDENNPIVYYVRPKRDAANAVTNPNQIIKAPAQSPQLASLPKAATGVVHNLKLGFGFIAPDDGSENLFFHATEVVGCTIFDLRPGDAVEYEPSVNERGLCALKVRRVS